MSKYVRIEEDVIRVKMPNTTLEQFVHHSTVSNKLDDLMVKDDELIIPNTHRSLRKAARLLEEAEVEAHKSKVEPALRRRAKAIREACAEEVFETDLHFFLTRFG